MSVRATLKSLVGRIVQQITGATAPLLRNSRNVDLVLSAAMHEPNAVSAIYDPVAYIDLMRACMERAVHVVTEVKTENREAQSDSVKIAARRFVTLLEQMRWGLPAIDFSVAREVAGLADRNRRRPEPLEFGEWAGDMGLHFSVSSSFGEKGRILFNIIRFMRSERCLELGTAYGVSALFLLEALKRYGNSGHLTTVEGWERLFLLSSSMLKDRYGEAVSCHLGRTQSVLPELVNSLGRIDFMFHDAGHSRDDYISDFNRVIEILVPGAVVLFDDIRWENPRMVAGKSRTYEGWREVVAHPRVRRAVELDDMLGLLLLG